MRAAELAPRLQARQVGANQWAAKCPAHDDKSPSLRISDGEKGLVLTCLAGCQTRDVLSALGLELKDLFYEETRPRPVTQPAPVTLAGLASLMRLTVEQLAGFGLREGLDGQGRKVVVVPYLNPAGELVREKLRCSLTGKPKYIWREGDATLPYGEWKLTEAAKGALIITEGESDCWSLWSVGVPALGLPGATQKKLLESRHLEGIKKVWLCEDRDEAGREFVTEVRARIGEVAPWVRTVRVLRAPEGCKDVTEWRRGCASPDEFLTQLRAACSGPLITASRVQPAPVEYTWRPYIPARTLTTLAGLPGSAKSFLSCAVAAALTTGKGPLTTGVKGPGHVIMMNKEDDRESVIVPRLMRVGADLSRVHLYDFDENAFFLGADGLAQLEEICSEWNPLAVVLDPVVDLMAADVDINRKRQVSSSLDALRMMARRLNTSIVIVCHTNKRSDPTHAQDSVAGDRAFVSVPRSLLMTYLDPEHQFEPGLKRRGYVLSQAKQNVSWEGIGLRYEVYNLPDDPMFPDEDRAMLRWVGESRYSSFQLSRIDPSNFQEVQEAVQFLEAALVMKRTNRELQKMARTAGVSTEMLNAAKHQLGVRKVQLGGGDGATMAWELPPKYKEEPGCDDE